MLRLFRDKHIYSLAFEKSLQISKVKTSPACKTKKPRLLDVTSLTTTEKGAKRFKTEAFYNFK